MRSSEKTNRFFVMVFKAVVCVCVCVRVRERDRKSVCVFFVGGGGKDVGKEWIVWRQSQ